MKTLKYLVIGILIIIACDANAQVAVTINIGNPPSWGPAGYTGARYYYLPDIECYYDIQLSEFIYNNGFGWIHKSYLPEIYRDYDLYSGYKVVMTDYHGNKPYVNFKKNKAKYAKGYTGLAQRNIGKKPMEKNFSPQITNKDHSNQKIHNNNSWKTRSKLANNLDKGKDQNNKKEISDRN